jgi:hypothetical protein
MSQKQDKTAARGRLQRLVSSFGFMKHLALIRAATDVLLRAQRAKKLTNAVLRGLSEWFRVKLSTASGTPVIVSIEPRAFARISVLAVEAACGERHLGCRAFARGNDFRGRIHVARHRANENPAPKICN